VATSRPAVLEVDRLLEVAEWVGARRQECLERHERLEDYLRRLGEDGA
jgi:hypothetical protein